MEAQPLPEVVTPNSGPPKYHSSGSLTPTSPPPAHHTSAIFSPDSLTHDSLFPDDGLGRPKDYHVPISPQPTPTPAQQVYREVIYTPYGVAIPLASVSQSPVPVDCPVCGHRQMTRVELHSGNTTQYVSILFPFSRELLCSKHEWTC